MGNGSTYSARSRVTSTKIARPAQAGIADFAAHGIDAARGPALRPGFSSIATCSLAADM